MRYFVIFLMLVLALPVSGQNVYMPYVRLQQRGTWSPPQIGGIVWQGTYGVRVTVPSGGPVYVVTSTSPGGSGSLPDPLIINKVQVDTVTDKLGTGPTNFPNGLTDNLVSVATSMDSLSDANTSTAVNGHWLIYNGADWYNCVPAYTTIPDFDTGVTNSTHAGRVDNPHQVTGVQVGFPATTLLQVDGSRVDVYVADGTMLRPFKTIMAAVNQVIANGDNTSAKPYTIKIAPGTYAETIILENTALKHLQITGSGPYIGLNVSVNAVQSTTENDAFSCLIISNMLISGNVTIEGESDGTSAFGNDLSFTDCYIGGTASFKNFSCGGLNRTKANGAVLFQNGFGWIEDNPGQNPGATLTVQWDDTAKKPSGATNCYVILGNTLAGVTTIQRLGSTGSATVQARNGVRFAYPGSTLTVGANTTLLCYSGAAIRSNVVNNGSIVLGGGSYIIGTLTGNTPTLDQKSVYNGFDPSGTGLSAINLQTAITELDARLSTKATYTSTASSISTTITHIFVDASGNDIELAFQIIDGAEWYVMSSTNPGVNTITVKGVTGNINGVPTNTNVLANQWDAKKIYCNGTDLFIWPQ